MRSRVDSFPGTGLIRSPVLSRSPLLLHGTGLIGSSVLMRSSVFFHRAVLLHRRWGVRLRSIRLGLRFSRMRFFRGVFAL